MYKLFIIALGLAAIVATSCSDGGSTEESDNASYPGAKYADFGVMTSTAIPDGLKTAGEAAGTASQGNSGILLSSSPSIPQSNSNSVPGCYRSTEPNRTGPCLMVESSDAGELFMKVWAMDYDNECTEEQKREGKCFTCPACNPDFNGGNGTNYLKPTLLENPSSCATLDYKSAKYVNFGIDPCDFDSKIAPVQNIETCKNGSESNIDVTPAIPWASKWGIPTEIAFAGFNSDMLWRVTDTAKYFVRVNSETMFAGYKDPSNDVFMYFGVGSAASSFGKGGPNLSGYAGSPTGKSGFETIQLRNQTDSTGNVHQYINRIKSSPNQEYVYMQIWHDNSSGSGGQSSGQNDIVDNINSAIGKPDSSFCAKMNSTVSKSQFVAISECITAFDVDTEAKLNAESLYTFKLFPLKKLNEVVFSSLTSDYDADGCIGD